MLAWRRGYDDAGIIADDRPPDDVAATVRTADLVVSSDFARAIMTAERLAGDREFRRSPLLREAPVDVPTWTRVRLPRVVWERATQVRWGYRILRGTDIPSHDLERGTKAARWLDELTREHPHVAVVTHGVFRRILARQLEALGWRADGRIRSWAHWSVWSLTSGEGR